MGPFFVEYCNYVLHTDCSPCIWVSLAHSSMQFLFTACEKSGQEYTECGTACPSICHVEQPAFCTEQCVVGCQCPPGLFFDTASQECVSECGRLYV